jgi:hypothetical protein
MNRCPCIDWIVIFLISLRGMLVFAFEIAPFGAEISVSVSLIYFSTVRLAANAQSPAATNASDAPAKHQ